MIGKYPISHTTIGQRPQDNSVVYRCIGISYRFLAAISAPTDIVGMSISDVSVYRYTSKNN